MNGWVRLILFFVGFAAVALIVYNLLRVYVFSKLKVNKWVILGIAIAVFLIQTILASTYKNTILDYGLSLVFIILFLWFFDMTKYGANNPRNKKPEYKTVPYKKDKNKKDVVIKPKAKPNRVRNINNKEE